MYNNLSQQMLNWGRYGNQLAQNPTGYAPQLTNIGFDVPGLNSQDSPTSFMDQIGGSSVVPNPAWNNDSGGSDFFSMKSFLGDKDSMGWGTPVMGGLQSLLGAYTGMKQYGIAKDRLKESKRQFDLNYGAQQKSMNTRLRDRQAARVASNPNAYESVGSYMDKNRI